MSPVYVFLWQYGQKLAPSPLRLCLSFPLSPFLSLCQDKLKYCHSLSMMIDAWVYLSCGWPRLYQALISPSCFRCNCYIRSYLPCLLLYWRNRCGSVVPKCISGQNSTIEAGRRGFVNCCTAKSSQKLRNYTIHLTYVEIWIILD